MIFKESPELVYSGLKRKIGSPVDYEKNEANPEIFDKNDVDLTVPIEETFQHQSKLINVCIIRLDIFTECLEINCLNK